MRKNGIILSALAVFFITVILISYILINNDNTEKMETDVLVRISEAIEPNIVSFQLQVGEQIKKVKTMADHFGNVGQIGDEDQIDLLKSAAEHNGLLRCAMSFPDGSFVTHDAKNEGNVLNDAFHIEGMKGNFFISDPRPAVVDATKSVMLFAGPIIKDETVQAVLIYSYLCDDMDKIFNLSFANNQGEIFVVNKNGDILIGDTSLIEGKGNIVDYINEHCSHKSHPGEECLIIDQEEEVVKISLEGTKEETYVSYYDLGMNDWHFVATVPRSAITATLDSVNNNQLNFGIVLFCCVLMYVGIAIYLLFSKRANIDKLSGAPTQECFNRTVKKMLKNNPGQKFVVIKLDVKDLKLINRIYDYTMGDRVIRNISLALKKITVEEKGAYARVSGDDFLALLPFSNREYLNELRQKFIITFRELMGKEFKTNMEFPTGQYITSKADAQKPDLPEIYEKVNFAHRSAKRNNLKSIVDYESTIEKDALFKKEIEDKMEKALDNGEFALYLQPKYKVSDEKCGGAEALVRWQVAGRLIMHPTDFVPVFEQNGFIVKIDMYMFEKAVEKIKGYIDEGVEPPVISVNFSRYHLYNELFVQDLCAIVDKYNVPHNYLEIELTESVVFENLDKIKNLINDLHNAKFTLSMDDFGSGYSSLSLLKDLHVDVIKIDRDFFKLSENEDAHRLEIVIANILNMTKELNIKTVAEGVEIKEHVLMLRKYNCDLIQGFYYAKPMPADEFSID